MLQTSPTATKDVPDGHWVLGHTQKQSGSAFQSGIRAVVTPSEITQALSTMQGRIMARTMLATGISEKLFTYSGFRPYAANEVIRRVLPENSTEHIIVDPASGYNPQFYRLAQERPNTQFIEIDRPVTINDKEKRLKAHNIPQNLTFIPADLSETTLDSVLGERKADLIITVAAYVTMTDFEKLLAYLPTVLKDDGIVLTAFPYAQGVENITQTLSLFKRVVTKPIGIVQHADEVINMFERAGYRDIKIHWLSKLAEEMGKPIPADAELFVTARR